MSAVIIGATAGADSVDTSFNNTYVYDAFGRLIQENNKALDKTFIFDYNEIGNITSAKADPPKLLHEIISLAYKTAKEETK